MFYNNDLFLFFINGPIEEEIYFFTKEISNNFLYPLVEGGWYGIITGIKSCIMVFIFIWVRASFPRIRFDQLMSFSWTILLPIIIAFIVWVPCILFIFNIIPTNINLF